MTVYLKKLIDEKEQSVQSQKLLAKIYNKPYTLKRNEYGKPYIKENPEFYFNISHSGSWICLAVGNNPLGIDIQKHDKNRIRIAQRYFTENEQTICESSPNAFFDIWTRKEAFVKALGVGLSYGLKSFDAYNIPAGYDVKTLDAPIGYSLSVCEKISEIKELQITYVD